MFAFVETLQPGTSLFCTHPSVSRVARRAPRERTCEACAVELCTSERLQERRINGRHGVWSIDERRPPAGSCAASLSSPRSRFGVLQLCDCLRQLTSSLFVARDHPCSSSLSPPLGPVSSPAAGSGSSLRSSTMATSTTSDPLPYPTLPHHPVSPAQTSPASSLVHTPSPAGSAPGADSRGKGKGKETAVDLKGFAAGTASGVTKLIVGAPPPPAPPPPSRQTPPGLTLGFFPPRPPLAQPPHTRRSPLRRRQSAHAVLPTGHVRRARRVPDADDPGRRAARAVQGCVRRALVLLFAGRESAADWGR